MADFAVIPERTALLTVKMHHCFIQGYSIAAPDGPALLERINRLATASGFRVFFLCNATATFGIGDV